MSTMKSNEASHQSCTPFWNSSSQIEGRPEDFGRSNWPETTAKKSADKIWLILKVATPGGNGRK